MAGEREFDFWLGEWECRWEDGRGSNTVTAELDGAVIFERFDGRPGTPLRGMSVSVYDQGSDVWRQTWVDSTRGYLDFVGGISEDEMVLHRTTQDNGTALHYRMRFTEVEDASFKWLWERSRDDRESWELCWLIDYSRRG